MYTIAEISLQSIDRWVFLNFFMILMSILPEHVLVLMHFTSTYSIFSKKKCCKKMKILYMKNILLYKLSCQTVPRFFCKLSYLQVIRNPEINHHKNVMSIFIIKP